MKLKAKRSILLKHIDDNIYDHTDNEIKSQTTEKQDSLDVDEIYKFLNSKITFISYEMGEKSLKDIKQMFSHYIPPSNVYKDEFIEEKTCYKYYKLNHHHIYECPEDRNFIVCSKCVTLGHNFKE